MAKGTNRLGEEQGGKGTTRGITVKKNVTLTPLAVAAISLFWERTTEHPAPAPKITRSAVPMNSAIYSRISSLNTGEPISTQITLGA